MEIYFLKTVNDGKTTRLRAMDAQYDTEGNDISTDLNIRADVEVRKRYETGQVFATDTLILEEAKKCYSAGRIFPVLQEGQLYRDANDIPTETMKEKINSQWRKYSAGRVTKDANGNIVILSFPEGSLLNELSKNPKYAVPTIEKDGFYVDPMRWYKVVKAILKKKNLMMVGESGTGKTELIRLACRKLGKTLHIFDMGAMHDAMSQLLGNHRIAVSESGASMSVFDYSPFVTAVQDENAVVLLDELSRAPGSTLNILFPCLDKRREIAVPQADGSEDRKFPVRCAFVATANIGIEYTGTASLDRALVDRFKPMELPFLEPEEEKNVLVKVTGVSAMDAAKVVAIANAVRNANRNQEISSSISLRDTLEIAEDIVDGESFIESCLDTLLPRFDGEERDVVRTIITQY